LLLVNHPHLDEEDRTKKTKENQKLADNIIDSASENLGVVIDLGDNYKWL
jgi:hypothetical protein